MVAVQLLQLQPANLQANGNLMAQPVKDVSSCLGNASLQQLVNMLVVAVACCTATVAVQRVVHTCLLVC
jgi:ABC-type enterochelin transport system permease subunit